MRLSVLFLISLLSCINLYSGYVAVYYEDDSGNLYKEDWGNSDEEDWGNSYYDEYYEPEDNYVEEDQFKEVTTPTPAVASSTEGGYALNRTTLPH